MFPQPESAASKEFNLIIDELNGLVQTEEDEFTKIRKLSELEHRALSFQHLPHGQGLCYSALGSIAAARGSIRKMHEYHNKSIVFDPRPIIHLNYASSLYHLDDLDEALDRASKVYDENRGNEAALNLLVKIAFKKRDEKMFVSFAGAFQKLTGEPHPLYAFYMDEVEEGHEMSKMCMLASASAFKEIYEQ
jgi:tetratricopeptide (TPR) repeat protein